MLKKIIFCLSSFFYLYSMSVQATSLAPCGEAKIHTLSCAEQAKKLNDFFKNAIVLNSNNDKNLMKFLDENLLNPFTEKTLKHGVKTYGGTCSEKDIAQMRKYVQELQKSYNGATASCDDDTLNVEYTMPNRDCVIVETKSNWAINTEKNIVLSKIEEISNSDCY